MMNCSRIASLNSSIAEKRTQEGPEFYLRAPRFASTKLVGSREVCRIPLATVPVITATTVEVMPLAVLVKVPVRSVGIEVPLAVVPAVVLVVIAVAVVLVGVVAVSAVIPVTIAVAVPTAAVIMVTIAVTAPDRPSPPAGADRSGPDQRPRYSIRAFCRSGTCKFCAAEVVASVPAPSARNSPKISCLFMVPSESLLWRVAPAQSAFEDGNTPDGGKLSCQAQLYLS